MLSFADSSLLESIRINHFRFQKRCMKKIITGSKKLSNPQISMVSGLAEQEGKMMEKL